MKHITLDYKGIDDWNRPVFKVREFDSVYVGSVDTLFTHEERHNIIPYFRKNKTELVLFGSKFNCEPMGTAIKSSLKIRFGKSKIK